MLDEPGGRGVLPGSVQGGKVSRKRLSGLQAASENSRKEPGAKESGQVLETRKGREVDCPPEHSEGNTVPTSPGH